MKAKPMELKVYMKPGETAEQADARTRMQPSVGAAVITASFLPDAQLDLGGLIEALDAQCGAVHGGNLQRAESMLIAQAHSLDAIYTACARRAARNIGEHIQAAEIYLKLALKAQSQSRATLDTLAAIKNPPVVFAKQANIAHGPQQVNNGSVQPVARTEETTIEPTEQSQVTHEERQRLDTGTPIATGAAHPAMATVEAIHRPAHRGRKGRV